LLLHLEFGFIEEGLKIAETEIPVINGEVDIDYLVDRFAFLLGEGGVCLKGP